MVKLIFESHGTTTDNESHLSSGHNDAPLSELGIKQARELGERYAENKPDAVFCSDLERAYQTATYAFGFDTSLIFVDWRLRECDYGELTQHPSDEVDLEKVKHISQPFPNGESYEQCAERMKSFLHDITQSYDGKTVMVIGHRATQYGLEHWINHKPLLELVSTRFEWQPGWQYQLGEIK